MEAKKVRQAITDETYEINPVSGCGCRIDWDIKNGELVCSINSDTCYTGQELVIDGEVVATYVRFESMTDYAVDNYPDDYDGDDDDDSLRDDVCDLIKMSEMRDRGDSCCSTEHDKNVKDALVDYIEYLVADGWCLYRDNYRGFANEYDCVLVAPTADKDDISDDWDVLTVDTWAKEYLYAGDAATEAYNGLKIID